MRLTATDSKGLSKTVTRDVQPHRVDVSFATEPSGLSVLITGNDGADALYGESGNDTLNSRDGVSGNDSLDGGAGTDKRTTDPTEKSIVGFP